MTPAVPAAAPAGVLSRGRRLVSFARRVAQNPPDVLAYRALQALRLEAMRRTNAWPALDRRVRDFWSHARVAAFIAQGSRSRILAPDGLATLRAIAPAGSAHERDLLAFGDRHARREFRVFDAAVPREGPFPWNADWRFDHEWPRKYFHAYDSYERRSKPYDVKMPWELSRLWFLLPMAQAAALRNDRTALRAVVDIVRDWDAANPLAASVNWYAMEVSVRGVALAMLLDVVTSAAPDDPALVAPLLQLITTHGAFLWRTVEYTDVRGNHFAANIVGLLLLGRAVRGAWSEAERWIAFARRHLDREIQTQFLSDGVNFEKSIPYHRFVTELFLLAGIAGDRDGVSISAAARERLASACRFTASYLPPDDRAPILGDTDDAIVVTFDSTEPRNHSSTLALAAAMFPDRALKPASHEPPASVAWLLGADGVAAWRRASLRAEESCAYFAAGGIAIARRNGHFLLADLGEVGLAGRGGHGHNDLLSFELHLSGVPVVVDPGSYVYSADTATRNLFRSTEYQNTLRVDHEEIAPLEGVWRISPVAQPIDADARQDGSRVVIRGAHTGYRRLATPVDHRRLLSLDLNDGFFQVDDELSGAGRHVAERFFHLSPGATLTIGADSAMLRIASRTWNVRWDSASRAGLRSSWNSSGYSQRVPAHVLVLETDWSERAHLSFTIASTSDSE